MIKADSKGSMYTIEISGQYEEVREEMLRIGKAVRKIPDRERRDELLLAFVMGALGDPDLILTKMTDKPDFDELIHSDEES